MSFPPRAVLLIRIAGVFWVVTGPALWVMAGIAPGGDVQALNTQLAVISGVALVAVVCGVGALFGLGWAARALHVLSWAVAASCFAMATYAVTLPFVPWTSLKEPGVAGLPVALIIAAMDATFGLPFLAVALLLGQAFRLRKRRDLRARAN